MGLHAAIMNDPFAHTGNLGRDESFQAFVNLLPTTLGELRTKRLTVATLMEAQHRALTYLVGNVKIPPDWLTDTQERVSQYAHAGEFLSVTNKSPDAFCLESGMTRAEIARMHQGHMTVDDLLLSRPAVIIAPLLLVLKARRMQ